MAHEYPTKIVRPSNSNPTTNLHIQANNTTMDNEAKPVNPKDVTICITTTIPKLTWAQHITAIEEEMSDNEQTAYLNMHDMELDFCSVGY